jgi:hypothetical protein
MPLSCHYHRLQLDRDLDQGYEPAGKTLAHVKSCGHCQQWYQSQRQMIHSLRRHAKTPGSQPSPQLLPGVLAAIRYLPEQELSSEQGRFTTLWSKWLVPAAVCVTVVIITQWNQLPDHNQTKIDSPKWLALSPEAFVEKTTGLSIVDWGDQLDEPLEQEWTSLKEDAKAAIDGMTGTFLPSNISLLYPPSPVQKP